MSTEQSSIGVPDTYTDLAGDSSATGQSIEFHRRLGEIQLARLSGRLRDLGQIREFVRARGEDPDLYARQLVGQYADIALKRGHQPPALAPNARPVRLTQALNQFANIFDQWKYVIAPNATVGLTQSPGSPHTGGSIGAEIYTGELALAGGVWNASTEEQWWVNTWQYIVPLPAAPVTIASGASLSYRFGVGADVLLYRQDVVSGSVYVYATVATTNDSANRKIDFSQSSSSDFIVAATLPVADVPAIVAGNGAEFSGTIPLLPGGTPAIGILIGVIISVVDGEVDIGPGEYSLIRLAPPDARTAFDVGKIEYHLDQGYWVEAVARMLNS